MKTTLTKRYTQVDRKGSYESELIFRVEVEIDTEAHTGEITQFISAHCHDFKAQTYTDITAIVFNHFHDEFDEVLSKVDWWEVYRVTQAVAA